MEKSENFETTFYSDKIKKALFEIYGTNIKKATLKTYTAWLLNILDLLCYKNISLDPFDVKKILSYEKDIIIGLRLNMSFNSYYRMLIFCLNLSKKIGVDVKIIDKYRSAIDAVKEKHELENNDNKIKDKENWASFEEIQKVFNEIKVKSKATCMDKIIVGIYTRLGDVVTRLDFGNMYYIFLNEVKKADSEKKNFVYYDGAKYTFVINEYKTEKKYGKIEIPVYDSEMDDLLKIWFANFNTEKKYFLVSLKDSKEPLSENALGKRIKNIFKKYLNKEITVNTIRHIKESETINSQDYDKLNLYEKIKKHQNLQHSFQTAHMYRKKEN